MSVHASTPAPQSALRSRQRTLRSRFLWDVPWKRFITYLLALFFTIWIIAPFSWIIITSFMYEAEAISVPPHWIPGKSNTP